jgi:diguanylate cyclase (GGDEF)-like protein
MKNTVGGYRLYPVGVLCGDIAIFTYSFSGCPFIRRIVTREQMDLRLIDIGSLIEMRDCIVDLTKLDFSVYDESGRLLVSSLSEDPLSLLAGEKHADFVKTCIGKAVMRKGVSMFKGPIGEHRCFIPVQAGESVIVFASNSFYTSAKDLDAFLVSRGSACGLSADNAKSLTRKIAFRDLKDVSDICRNAFRLYALFLRDGIEKNLNRERYKKVRTLMDLFSDIDQNTITEEGVFDILCDGIIFLFAGDTVSLMMGSGEVFTPLLTAGRAKEAAGRVSLKRDSFLVADMLRSGKPVSCRETMELLRLGYGEEITALQVFPLFQGDRIFSLLCVFNSHLSEEDSDSISKLCRFSEFLLEHIRHRRSCARHTSNMKAMEFASSNLSGFTEPEALYESIIEISSRCIDSEKASLMMPDEDSGELLIKATRGMNKWIAKNIRVGIGRGIAGKVFREGIPIVTSCDEEDLPSKRRPNYRTGSFLSMPLKIGEETIGVLNFADKRTGEAFSEADTEFLSHFASYAAMAIRASQYYQMSEQLRTLSITDSLTGLFNRRYFDSRLFEELQRATRYDTVFTLAIFDIDDFKRFNDTEGHAAGDDVLKTLANIARESLRSIDILARFGGEEFSIIMPQTDKDEAFLVAERVRMNIREFMPAGWKKFPFDKLTVSIGIATFPADGKDAKALIRCADKALYRAKVTGKDRTEVWGLSGCRTDKPESGDSGKN